MEHVRCRVECLRSYCAALCCDGSFRSLCLLLPARRAPLVRPADFFLSIRSASGRMRLDTLLSPGRLLGFPIVHPSRAPRGDGVLHHHPAHRRIPLIIPRCACV
eukprot:scaffold25695_cov145-Isochrysis_galbana.AAC.1